MEWGVEASSPLVLCLSILQPAGKANKQSRHLTHTLTQLPARVENGLFLLDSLAVRPFSTIEERLLIPFTVTKKNSSA